jgi:hypothetical protein
MPLGYTQLGDGFFTGEDDEQPEPLETGVADLDNDEDDGKAD